MQYYAISAIVERAGHIFRFFYTINANDCNSEVFDYICIIGGSRKFPQGDPDKVF